MLTRKMKFRWIAVGNDTAAKAAQREGMNECVSRACKGAGRGVRSFNTNRFSATARPPFHPHLQLKCWGVPRGASFAAGQLLS